MSDACRGRPGKKRPELFVPKVALEAIPLRRDLLLAARLPVRRTTVRRTSALMSSESVSGMRSRLSRVKSSLGLVPSGA